MLEEGTELVSLEMSDELAESLSEKFFSEVTENGGHLVIHSDEDELVNLITQLLSNHPELQGPVSAFLKDAKAKNQATIQ